MEAREGKLRIEQIKNPLWLGAIAPSIKIFVDKIEPIGITYETMYSYLVNSVQHGGDNSEFWVVFYEDKPTAFGHWYVMGLPHVGKVCCDYVTSWNTKKEPVEMLMDKFVEFGIKHRAPVYEGYALNERIYRVWRRAAFKKGIGIKPTGIINFQGRKEWQDKDQV